MGLQHVDAHLEDKLPKTIGGVQLAKMSVPLSTYMASSPGGDKTLYTPWLVPFGKSPDDVDIAIAAPPEYFFTGATPPENFFIQAIEVPGQNAAALSNGFADVARAKKWPVGTTTVGDMTILSITDPSVTASGLLSQAYVWSSGDILYLIVTDDPNLMVEAMAKLQTLSKLP